jgi:acyl transferase domain-containing protein
VMSLEEGLRLVAARGRLMQRVGGGAMVAVGLSEAEVKRRLTNGLSVAAVNGPQLSVVSGPQAEVEQFVERMWEEEGVSCQRLKVAQGFHSALMDEVMEEFEAELRRVKLQTPQMRYISNVSGTWVQQEEAVSPQYWTRQMRETVRYWEGLTEVTSQDGEAEQWVMLEVGPGHTLTRLAMRQGHDRARLVTSVEKEKTQPEQGQLITALGRLWLAGTEIEWPQFYAREKRRRIRLPTYPFEREYYWVSPGHHAAVQSEVMKDSESIAVPAPSIESPVSSHPRPNLSTTYVAPRSEPEQTIAAIWRHALGVNQIGIDDNFFDLGGDSLVAIQVAQQLKTQFQIDVPATNLYEGLTIRQLIPILGLDEDSQTFAPENNGAKDERPLRRKLYQQKQRARKGRHEAA